MPHYFPSGRITLLHYPLEKLNENFKFWVELVIKIKQGFSYIKNILGCENRLKTPKIGQNRTHSQ